MTLEEVVMVFALMYFIVSLTVLIGISVLAYTIYRNVQQAKQKIAAPLDLLDKWQQQPWGKIVMAVLPAVPFVMKFMWGMGGSKRRR